MGPRSSIAAGLAAGIVVAIVLLAVLVAVLPTSGRAVAPTASPAPPSVGPAATASSTPSSPPSGPLASPTLIVTGFHVGQPAPALHVPQVGGGTIDLTALRGKPVWVYFMATWCPSCQDEVPIMESFAVRYAASGLVVLGVDVREDQGTVAAFASRLGATFPIGLDADGSAQSRWGALALPTHFWVDKSGVVRYGAVGGIGPDVMATGLRTILPGVTVTP